MVNRLRGVVGNVTSVEREHVAGWQLEVILKELCTHPELQTVFLDFPLWSLFRFPRSFSVNTGPP